MFSCEIVPIGSEIIWKQVLPAFMFTAFLGEMGKIFKFCQKHVKVHKICYYNHQKPHFDLGPPPIPLMTLISALVNFRNIQL